MIRLLLLSLFANQGCCRTQEAAEDSRDPDNITYTDGDYFVHLPDSYEDHFGEFILDQAKACHSTHNERYGINTGVSGFSLDFLSPELAFEHCGDKDITAYACSDGVGSAVIAVSDSTQHPVYGYDYRERDNEAVWEYLDRSQDECLDLHTMLQSISWNVVMHEMAHAIEADDGLGLFLEGWARYVDGRLGRGQPTALSLPNKPTGRAVFELGEFITLDEDNVIELIEFDADSMTFRMTTSGNQKIYYLKKEDTPAVCLNSIDHYVCSDWDGTEGVEIRYYKKSEIPDTFSDDQFLESFPYCGSVRRLAGSVDVLIEGGKEVFAISSIDSEPISNNLYPNDITSGQEAYPFSHTVGGCFFERLRMLYGKDVPAQIIQRVQSHIQQSTIETGHVPLFDIVRDATGMTREEAEVYFHNFGGEIEDQNYPFQKVCD